MLGTLCALLAVVTRGIAVPFATPGRFLLTRDGLAGLGAERETRGIYTTPEPYTALLLASTGRPPLPLGGDLHARGNATPGPATEQLRAPRPSSSPIVTTPAPAPSVEEEDDEEEGPDLIQRIRTQFRLFLACVPRWGAMSCIKLEALLLLQGEDAHLTSEGNLGDPESRHGLALGQLSSDPKARDAYLNKMLVNAIKDILEDTLVLEDDDELRSRGIRRRRNRWNSPLLAFMFGLGALIIIAGISKTAMVAGKALAVSTLALVVAVGLGLRGAGGRRGGGGGGGLGNYEILATGYRRRVGTAGSAPSGPGPQPFGHLYLDAEADQAQAYSAHHTRP